MDSTGNVLLAAAAGGQSRPHGRLRGRTPPSARSPPPGPAPWLEGLPVPPPAAQKSHARRAQGTPRAAATAGVRCWALGVQGCRRPSPDASPTFTHSRVPRRQPGREAGSGNARAQCVSLWERHRNSRRKERNGKGPAARRELSREAAALARAGQGRGASVQGTRAGLAGHGRARGHRSTASALSRPDRVGAGPASRAGGGRAGLSLPPRGTVWHRCWEFWACWHPLGGLGPPWPHWAGRSAAGEATRGSERSGGSEAEASWTHRCPCRWAGCCCPRGGDPARPQH